MKLAKWLTGDLEILGVRLAGFSGGVVVFGVAGLLLGTLNLNGLIDPSLSAYGAVLYTIGVVASLK